jgi:hypothetical protein
MIKTHNNIDVNEMVGGFFRDKAHWRRHIAESFPSDPRNQRSADRLTELAEFVTTLPADHPALVAIGSVKTGRSGALVVGAELNYMASRFGLNSQPRYDMDGGFEAFLFDFADAFVVDHDEEQTPASGGQTQPPCTGAPVTEEIVASELLERIRPFFASRSQVAGMLGGISERTVDRLIERGELSAKRIDHRVMISLASVLEYAEVVK